MTLKHMICGAAALLALQAIPSPARAGDQNAAILARLDALEKENTALRQRLHRLEREGTGARQQGARVASTPTSLRASELDDPMPAAPALTAHASAAGPVKAAKAQPVRYAPPRFELSGSLLYLQPGAGNLEYGTLITPFPIPTPSWANQSLDPRYKAAFRAGARYMPNESNDVELSWTHQRHTTSGSFHASPTQMVGPPYLIGPESALYKHARGEAQFDYDSVNLDGGHTFCADCSFRLRVFGGVEAARLSQTLSGTFQSPDATASTGYTNYSSFVGAGPRLGLSGRYVLGDAQFIGEVAAAGLIGNAESRIDFATISPALGLNNQSLTSPDATQVIPALHAKLATAYTLPPSSYGALRIEAGWQASIYFNVVSQYSLNSVPTAPVIPPVGIYLATAQHHRVNFTNQGPYVTGSWSF